MSDILNIRVTERELDLIMDLLNEFGDRCDADGQPGFELCHDLMEQAGRGVDEWDSTDLDNRVFIVAEDDFIKRGMDAREQTKMHSEAANRRNFNLKIKDKRLSKTQTHDVWDPSDPKNW